MHKKCKLNSVNLIKFIDLSFSSIQKKIQIRNQHASDASLYTNFRENTLYDRRQHETRTIYLSN